MALDRDTALAVINALRSGTVPPDGLEHLAVGIEPLAGALREQRQYVARGHGAYKFVRGAYGSGKTFLTSLAAAQALEEGFVESRVVISVADTPLYRLVEVYRRMCQGLTTRGRRRGALQSILDQWLYTLEQQVIEVEHLDEDDPRFPETVGQAVRTHLAPVGREAGRLAACVQAYHEAQFRQEFAEARGILDWIAGEPKVSAALKRKAGVTGQLDNSDALTFLRGLLELMRAAGHRGLVLVLDEAETILRMRRQERLKSLEVLRQLVDAIDQGQFPHLYLLITGTPDFFDNGAGVPSLEPLHDRIRVEFRDGVPENLRQAQVRLKPFDRARLLEVARRVREIYPAACPDRLQERANDGVLDAVVDGVTQGFGGHVEVVPRLFLREWVNVLDLVDQEEGYRPLGTWTYEDRPGLDLSPEEDAALHGGGREVEL